MGEPVQIRAIAPRHYSAQTIMLECDRCGEQSPTALYYLSFKASRMPAKGFYASMGFFRLCRACLMMGVDAIDELITEGKV